MKKRNLVYLISCFWRHVKSKTQTHNFVKYNSSITSVCVTYSCESTSGLSFANYGKTYITDL